MNLLCKFFVGSCLCFTLVTRVEAKDEQGQAGLHHHPPQDRLLHDRFYSTTRMPDHPPVSCCNDVDCYPTEMRYVDGNIHAERGENGTYIALPPEKAERNGENPDGRHHFVLRRPIAPTPTDTAFRFASGGAT